MSSGTDIESPSEAPSEAPSEVDGSTQGPADPIEPAEQGDATAAPPEPAVSSERAPERAPALHAKSSRRARVAFRRRRKLGGLFVLLAPAFAIIILDLLRRPTHIDGFDR